VGILQPDKTGEQLLIFIDRAGVFYK